MTAPAQEQKVSQRLTAPTFPPAIAMRIAEAAEKEGRTVANFIAYAARLEADRVLGVQEK